MSARALGRQAGRNRRRIRERKFPIPDARANGPQLLLLDGDDDDDDLMAMSASAADNGGTSKRRMSPWIPVSLLTVTTVALAVPLVLLRRQQRSSTATLGRAIDSASAPPPRRSTVRAPLPTTYAAQNATASRGTSSAPPPRRVVRTTPELSGSALAKESPAAAAISTSEASTAAGEDFFNAPLYTLKAFSIATTLVIVGGVASIWGVKTYMGVRDTEEFATTMRQTLLEKMPFLASRIHRPPSSDPLPPTAPFSSPGPVSASPSSSPQSSASSRSKLESWTWSAAQAQLSRAYEKGGVSGWMEAVAIELEIEAELERRRKGLWADEKTRAGGSDNA